MRALDTRFPHEKNEEACFPPVTRAQQKFKLSSYEKKNRK